MTSPSDGPKMPAPSKSASRRYPLSDIDEKNPIGLSLVEQQSGRFGYGKNTLHWEVRSDIGPLEAEKNENQDAIGTFWCDNHEHGLNPFIIVAVADGVSDSPWSREGARFAVWSALMNVARRLIETEHFHDKPKQFFQEVFDETIKNIENRMSSELAAITKDFEKEKPNWAIPVGWKDWVIRRRLKEKNIFCTTLLISVVFATQIEKKRINWRAAHAAVGDGGLTIWRRFFDPKIPHEMGSGEIVDGITSTDETMLSHYLSPQANTFPQCFYSDDLGEHFAILLSTDGIARNKPLRDIINGPVRERIRKSWTHQYEANLLQKIIRRRYDDSLAIEDNLASKVIEEIKNGSEVAKFLDNLTLAIISCY